MHVVNSFICYDTLSDIKFILCAWEYAENWKMVRWCISRYQLGVISFTISKSYFWHVFPSTALAMWLAIWWFSRLHSPSYWLQRSVMSVLGKMCGDKLGRYIPWKAAIMYVMPIIYIGGMGSRIPENINGRNHNAFYPRSTLLYPYTISQLDNTGKTTRLKATRHFGQKYNVNREQYEFELVYIILNTRTTMYILIF